jgi:4-amino-4-deoxy-L-arabinose transferase-like glycosyltransferase
VVLAGLVLRLLSLHLWPPLGLVGDERGYVRFASEWADLGAIPRFARAPGYVWFIGAHLRWLADGLEAARFDQAVLGALSAALLFWLGRGPLGARPALLAAALFALDPTLVVFSHYFLNETLHLFLLLAASLVYLHHGADRRPGSGFFAGLLLGLASLVKAATLPFVAALVAWELTRRRGAGAGRLGLDLLRGATPLLLGWGVVVLPYCTVASVRAGAPVLVDTSMDRTLWHGNRLDYSPGLDWRVRRNRIHEAVDRQGIEAPDDDPRHSAAILRQELSFIAHNPLHFLAGIPKKLGALWNPTSFLHRRISFGAMQGAALGSGTALVLGLLTTLFYVLTLALGSAGLVYSRRSELRTFTLLLLLVTLVAHGVFVGISRYRLPVMPFLFLFGADLALDPARLRRARLTRHLLLLVTWVLLFWSWWPYWAFVWLG